MKDIPGRSVLGCAAAFLIIVQAASTPAVAETACVTCEGPPATYSCSPSPDAGPEWIGLSGRRLQFSCIEDIARRFQHATCSVRRNQLGSCLGTVHMLTGGSAALVPSAPNSAQGNQAGSPQIDANKAGSSGQSPSPPEQALPSPVQNGAAALAAKNKAAPSAQNDEPKTVIELAKQTAKTTQKELDKSADKVSDAARSTWRCISTLFQKC